MFSHTSICRPNPGRALRVRLPRLVCLLAFALSVLASAQTTIHVPADQLTIQAGINAANNGDTVLVAPGTYYENIDFKGKAITVISSGGAAATILDGSKGNKPAVFFISGEPRQSVLSGFTIQGGGVENGTGAMGGILYQNSAQASLVNDIITHNHCYGVWAESGSPLIQNSDINNTLDANGDCEFFAGGAAIWLDEPALDGSSNIVPAVIIGNTIEDNTQSGQEDAAGNGGAGIAVWGGDPVIENNIIRNNHTYGGNGGAILVQSGIYSPNPALMIVQNLIYGNQAGGGGGALAFDGFLTGVQIYVANNTIVDNTYADEPSMSNDYAVAQIYSGDYGFDGPSIAFVNNIIAGNTTSPAIQCGWEGLQAPDEAAQPIFDHNILLNKGGPVFADLCVDVSAKYGNLSADPMFVNWSDSDYHLQSGSPAIDAGNTSVLQSLTANGLNMATDFDGNPRVADATAKGYPIIDMGAYEYAGVQDSTPTTIVLTPAEYEVAAGTRLMLTAQLVSATGTPDGSVAFLEDGSQIGTAEIGGSGIATLTTAPLVPGTHSFLAKYPAPGDTSSMLPPATSVVVIVKADPYSVTLVLNSAPNPSSVGQNVAFTINSSSPDGTHPGPIVLTDQSTNTTLATLAPDTNGNAGYSTAALAQGVHEIVASYAGDSAHASALADVEQQVLAGYPTSLTLESSLDPSYVGQAVTFTATVSSTYGVPTTGNTLTILDGSTPLVAFTGGIFTGSVTTSTLTVGQHNISATFTNTSGYLPSQVSIIQTVNGTQTTTTLAASPNPAYALAPVVLTAKVASTAGGTPTGRVTFYDGGTSLGAANVSSGGTAVLSAKFSAASATPHQLTAVYSGDATFGASTSAPYPETIQFNPTTTLITTMVPNPVDSFGIATLSATVSSSTSPGNTPTGSITFTAGAQPLGSGTLVKGAVSVPIVAPAPGSYPVIANYSGDTAFFPSASPAQTLNVIPDIVSVTLASSKNPSVYGDSVTFSAGVFMANPAAKAAASGPPLTGSFTFFDGKTQLGQPVQASSAGTATYTISTLAVGTHPITAVYSGNADVTGATSSVLNQVVQAYTGNFTLSASPGSATLYTGEWADFTVTATPQGGSNLPLSLSCTDLPANTKCSFRPGNLTSGAYQSQLVLETTAPSSQAASRSGATHWTGGAAALACLCGLLIVPKRIRRALHVKSILIGAILIGAFAAISGCGGGGTLTGGTPPGTYNIGITAQTTSVAPQLSHSVTMKVVVKSLF